MQRLAIDACKAGWLLARADPTPGPLTFELVRDLTPVFAEAEAAFL